MPKVRDAERKRAAELGERPRWWDRYPGSFLEGWRVLPRRPIGVWVPPDPPESGPGAGRDAEG